MDNSCNCNDCSIHWNNFRGVAQADTTDAADNQSVATQPISDQQANNNSNNNKQTQT